MTSPGAIDKRLKVATGAAAAAGLVRFLYPYLERDYNAIRSGRAFAKFVKANLDKNRYFVDLFEDAVEQDPYKTFIIYENTIYTYGDINTMANKLANFARGQGFKVGDCAAILMYNEPTYIWSYLGFAKLGMKCAFINYNLRAESLINCLDVTDAKILMLADDPRLLSTVENIAGELEQRNIGIWTTGCNAKTKFRNIDDDLANISDQAIPREVRSAILYSDVSIYSFTSGTTGHPKAARISYFRQMRGTFTFHTLGVNSNDCTYICMPLYHSSASLLSFGSVVRSASTMVLARKFSIHKFWDDCRRHGITIIFYIGEICRYLLSLPEHPDDKRNSVRVAIGNGLRPDIWKRFQQRFNIPLIHEFYGATEGNFYSANTDNTVGAVGRLSPLIKYLTGFHVVKFDYETAEPVRDSKGRCMPTKLGTAGLLIKLITETARFEGYAGNKDLTEKKIIRNAFVDGDAYFNTGDVMMLDKNYYLYFVDRLGDTFRWKGENVATTEVSDIVSMFPGIAEANVYGVKVPGQDGRAGMAAIVVKDESTFSMQEFHNYITSSLPLYACPKFLRIMKNIDKTVTFKYRKIDLVREGFHPEKIKQKLYFYDFENKTYSPLDGAAYSKIVIGKARL
ncbi:long-chain fatty acid transport protein 2-like [Saccoglossus kowalevskii]|uniref:Long-chain-fatty-acid--CoA ligase n=1 Tax=Saccoglossus kowalevskii TaxID=10224 RepID=A0ABM0GZS4_SACKO|nr:PREDICTED: very long-chain acyl-CoA synthetase-like [Saccoglossus kowalevskii]